MSYGCGFAIKDKNRNGWNFQQTTWLVESYSIYSTHSETNFYVLVTYHKWNYRLFSTVSWSYKWGLVTNESQYFVRIAYNPALKARSQNLARLRHTQLLCILSTCHKWTKISFSWWPRVAYIYISCRIRLVDWLAFKNWKVKFGNIPFCYPISILSQENMMWIAGVHIL